MKYNILETIMGFVVLLAVAIFLIYGIKTAKVDTKKENQNIYAIFENVSGFV